MKLPSFASYVRAVYKRRQEEESGIALVELLVAITILVGILTATAMSLMQGLTIQNQNNQYNQAVQVAQIELDKVKSLTYKSIGFLPSDVAAGTKTYELPNGESVSVDQSNGCCGIYATFSVENSSMAPFKTVSHELTEGGEVSQQYTVVTTVMKEGERSPLEDSSGETDCAYSKRVTVKVYWIEGSGKLKSTGLSYLKAPDVRECVPQNIYGSVPRG